MLVTEKSNPTCDTTIIKLFAVKKNIGLKNTTKNQATNPLFL